MSEYAFKNLSEIDIVAEPAEGTTVMGFEDGKPIQMPMDAVKTKQLGGVFVINTDDPDYSDTDVAYGNKVKEALLDGKQVWIYTYTATTTITNRDTRNYFLVDVFTIKENTASLYYLYVESTAGNMSLSFSVTMTSDELLPKPSNDLPPV